MKKLILLILLTLISSWQVMSENRVRQQPRVVFCDVGQGDAVYLRLPEGIDVLVDAGPYRRVIDCLNEEMPYFDRHLELAFITHPQLDHYGGFKYVLQNYVIKALYLPSVIKSVDIESKTWQAFFKQARRQIAKIGYLERADSITVGNSQFVVLTPEVSAETLGVLGATNDDLNNLALGLLAEINEQQILLMSDLDAPVAERALTQLNLDVDIFKLNHHGSKYGISQKLLKLANPNLTVLSAGKNNPYGHPHPETLHLLQSLDIPVRRTDYEGKIVLKLRNTPGVLVD